MVALSFIEVIEMHNGDEPIVHHINLEDITETGLIIGRNQASCDIFIGEKIKNTNYFQMLSKKHATLYKILNKERDSYDYYLRRGYRDSNGEWVTPPQGVGLNIFVGGKALDRTEPIQLRTGALLELVPKIGGGYQCKLHWGVTSNGDSQPPTIPVDDNRLNEIQFENRILKQQSEIKENQINELQAVNERITTIIEQDKIEKEKILSDIAHERNKNIDQDAKIKQIRIYGAIVIAALLISLGVDIEQVERIAQVVAACAGGGLLYTATK